LTYSVVVSVAGGDIHNASVTDILPQYLDFVGFEAVPDEGKTNSAGSTLSWNWADLGAGSITVTYQAKVEDMLQAGMTFINNAQLKFQEEDPGIVKQSSVTAVLEGKFSVKVAVYNEAGELVKELPLKVVTNKVTGFDLTQEGILTGLNSSVTLLIGKVPIAVWDGTTKAGNPVTNGKYIVKVDSVDPYGVVTSVKKEVTVNRSLARITANIYNEAGEVVRHLYGVLEDPVGGAMTDVVLSAGVIEPGGTAPNDPSQLGVVLVNTVSPVTLTWDGKSDSGGWVTGGHYVLQVKWDNGKGEVSEITKGILVEGGQSPVGGMILGPNPLNMNQGTQGTFWVGVNGPVDGVRVKIYTLAGELKKTLPIATGTAPTISVNWDLTQDPWASGTYIAVAELMSNGNVVGRQKMKAFLVH